jgi:L-aspartate oxidase
LVPFNTATTQQLFTDCLVIGAGIAGLRAALEAAQERTVTLVCKGALSDSNTWNAQGGIASVLDAADSFEAHIADTMKTGGGIADQSIVEQVVKEGPALIHQLADWGTAFDRVDGEIDITLVRQTQAINIIENFFTIDLLTNDNGECIGAIGMRPSGSLQIIWAGATILATGGAGRLYREDGLAGRGDAAGHGVYAVSPDDAVYRRCLACLSDRNTPRRRGHPAGQPP